MRILVTGATGFIGRHLIGKLAGHHRLFCLVCQHKQLETGVANVTLIEGNLSQLDIHSLPSDLDVIIHLAHAQASFPEQVSELFHANIGGTQKLLEYGRCVGIKRFIYVSSGSIYGFGSKPFSESDPPHLLNFYAVSKYCSELLMGAYSSYFYTYGLHQNKRRISMVAERVIRGEPVSLVNNGQPRINPIYIDDFIRVIEATLLLNESVTVNVAGDEVIDMKELAEMIGRFVDRQPIFQNTFDTDMSDLIGNNELMHKLFPLGKLTSLQKGLKYMLAKKMSQLGRDVIDEN